MDPDPEDVPYAMVLSPSGERQDEVDVDLSLDYNFSLMENFERLEEESAPESYNSTRQTNPEVIQLLGAFGLEEDEGVREIRQRVRFVNWGNLLNIITWTPSAWGKKLGERTAARLCKATFRLSRLSYVDELMNFLQGAVENPEGRYEFDATPQALVYYNQEVSEVMPARKWTQELRRHILQEIGKRPAPPGSSRGGDIETPTVDAIHSETTDFPPAIIEYRNEREEEESKVSVGETTIQTTPMEDSGPPDPPSLRNSPQSQPASLQRQTNPPQPPPIPPVQPPNPPPVPTGGDDDDESRRKKDCRKKCFLNLLFLANVVVVLIVLDYGFGIPIFRRDDSPDDVPTSAPTTPAPTAAPTTEVKWIPVGADIFAPVSENGTAFGWSVAINSFGDVLAIGDPQGGDQIGRVYTYKLIEAENRFVKYGNDLEGDEFGCEFGNSTDLSDNADYLAVGARNRDNGRGQAMVFSHLGGTWIPRGQPLYGGNAPNDDFGNAVSISSSGRRVAVAAAREDVQGIGLGENTGVVRVFQYDETIRDWIQLGSDLIGKQAHEKFGFAVKLASSGEMLAVGAPFRHQSTNGQGEKQWRGSVDVFQYDPFQKDWVQWGNSINCKNHAERCGWSVDLSVNGRIMAVGAPVNDEEGLGSGQVRVYEFNSEIQDWGLRGDPIPGEEGRPGWFGNTVSLSSDGNRISTALWCDRPGLYECDYGVRMFTFNLRTKQWGQLGPDLPGKTRYDPYSTSLAMAKDDTIVMTSVDVQSEQTVVRAHRPSTL